MKLSTKKIAAILNISARGVRKRLLNIKPIEFQQSTGVKGTTAYYALEDLPADYRQKIMESQSLVPITVRKINNQIQVGKSKKVITVDNLTETQKQIGLLRVELIEAYKVERIAKQRTKGMTYARTLDTFLGAYNNGNFLPHIYKVVGSVNKKTFYRWEKIYRDKGLAGITPKHGASRKGSCKIREDEKKLLLEEYLMPNKPSVASAINYMRLRLAVSGNPSTTSTRTLQRWLSHYSSKNFDQVILMREGEKALTDKALPFVIRDKYKLAVGDVFVADGHVLNFLIKDPSKNNTPVRMTLVVFLDWRSGYPAGLSLMPTENIYNIHTALYKAILNLGTFPKVIYLDNGRAFKAKIFTKKSAQDLDFKSAGCSGLYKKYGMEVIFAKPYSGRSKVVERFFKELNKFEQQMPSYIGNNIENKPAHMMRNEKWHQAMSSDVVPTIEEVNAMLSGWLENVYGQQESKGLKPGETPFELFTAAKQHDIDPLQLAIDLAPEEKRLVGRNGVELFGIKYFDESLYGLREYVRVKYSFSNLKQVYVFDEQYNYICTAKAVSSKNPLAVLNKDSYDYQELKNDLRKHGQLKRATKKVAELSLSNRSATDADFFDIIGVPLPSKPVKQLPKQQKQLTPASLQIEQSYENDTEEMPLLDGMEKYIYLLEHGLENVDPEFITLFEETELWQTTYGSETGQIRLSQIKKKGQGVKSLKTIDGGEKEKTSAATPV